MRQDIAQEISSLKVLMPRLFELNTFNYAEIIARLTKQINALDSSFFLMAIRQHIDDVLFRDYACAWHIFATSLSTHGFRARCDVINKPSLECTFTFDMYINRLANPEASLINRTVHCGNTLETYQAAQKEIIAIVKNYADREIHPENNCFVAINSLITLRDNLNNV